MRISRHTTSRVQPVIGYPGLQLAGYKLYENIQAYNQQVSTCQRISRQPAGYNLSEDMLLYFLFIFVKIQSIQPHFYDQVKYIVSCTSEKWPSKRISICKKFCRVLCKSSPSRCLLQSSLMNSCRNDCRGYEYNANQPRQPSEPAFFVPRPKHTQNQHLCTRKGPS